MVDHSRTADNSKIEIWEEESFAFESTDQVNQAHISAPFEQIQPTNQQIQEELKAQESTNIFAPNGFEDGDPEINTDTATMSELDEINPPDAMSYNPQFFEAAHQFISVVDCLNNVPKKGRAFTEYLQTCFINVRNASLPEFEQLDLHTKLMDQDKVSDLDVPRSTKFILFADDLIKRCTSDDQFNKLMKQNKTNAIYNAIFKKFLTKTYVEAKYLLQQMSMVVKQSDPENNFDNTQNESATEIVGENRNQSNVSHLLLDINRTTNDLQTKEDSALKLFNYSVFKLACIFERVRLYMNDIVQPRDNKLQVIEVNLDNRSQKLDDKEGNFVNIWEKNDFIMTYQVLQIINNEIKRIENKNLDRTLFTEQISPFVDRRDTHKMSIMTDANSEHIISIRQTNNSEEGNQILLQRRTMQAFFLQEQRNLGQQAFQIHMDRWIKFTTGSRNYSNKQVSISNTLEQEVFLFFKIELKKSSISKKNMIRTFQLELMYHAGSAISQKVTFTSMPTIGDQGISEEHKFLFLQVPFKLLLGTDVFMIIKVFRHINSKSASEQDYVWTPSQAPGKASRNTFKFYEGYSLVNISDAFWSKNLKCGQNFHHPVHFYQPDKVQVVDDRFVQILREKSFKQHKELQNEFKPKVTYALYSNLVDHATDINLQQTKIVMMKRFTRALFQSRDQSSSQFLKNDPGSQMRSYTNEQLYDIDRQIRPYLTNLNEIKLDLHALQFNEATLIRQPFVRLQIFLRTKDQGCLEQIYGNFDEMALKSFSHQSFIVPVHQNRAIFRDTCFIKLPTKDQSSVKDFQIMVMVQFPLLTSDFVNVSDEQGNRIDTASMKQKLGIGRTLELADYYKHSDLITFKTEYINEIPLYDIVNDSVVQTANDNKLLMKRFVTRGFSIKKQNPCQSLMGEPNLILAYGIDVLSMYFTHEKALNQIITIYDRQNDLSEIDISHILQKTKEISPQTLVFHAEKLLSILLNIFCKTESPDGSSYAFEAILYVIKFFKSQKHLKDQRVVDDFITKRLQVSQASPVYPKLLFQMIKFAGDLEKSLEQGKPVGHIRQHFTLFKEMPTICSFIRQSFELEERQMEARNRHAMKNLQRKNTNRHRTNSNSDKKQPPTFGDIVKQQQDQLKNSTRNSVDANKKMNQSEDMGRFSQQIGSEYRDDMRGQSIRSRGIHNQSVSQIQNSNEKLLNIDEEKKETNLINGSENNDSDHYMISFQQQEFNKYNEMPVIQETEDEADELMSQREFRQSQAGREAEQSGFVRQNDLKHPTRKLTIVDNKVSRPERLLYKIQMPRDEFQKVIEIILMRICECLHKDINKSCFTLRMIFYKNLCGILEHFVSFLNQKNIRELFNYLVKPLQTLNQNNLEIEQNHDDHLNESQRQSQHSSAQSASSIQFSANMGGNSLMSEKQMVNQGVNKRGLNNVRMRVFNYLSQENFWVSELAGQEEVNTNEFVRRIITMGQFLESRAIEKLPNNPSLGRRISSQFALFISESSGDFSAHKKNSTFLQNISPNLKAHSLLYILHQIFKHENRFAQLFDLDADGTPIAIPKSSDAFNDNDDMMSDSNLKMINSVVADNNDDLESRLFNRQSMQISEYGDYSIAQDPDQNELLALTFNKKKGQRLDYFTKDSDYYTTLLLSIVKMQSDVELPHEIMTTLEPVREKCQLIIFQLVTLLNRQTLSWFIHRKKQLRSLLQNTIELIMSDSLEFRSPFTLYGGEKKLLVFEKFTNNLYSELVSLNQYQLVLSYKDTYRPILSSIWLIQLLIYVQRLKVLDDRYLSEEEYKEGTWNMFNQFTDFWSKFSQKRRMLVQTEANNEKHFHNAVIDCMRRAIQKEAKHNCFHTCQNMIYLLYYYEQEYFKLKNPDKLDMKTQLVRICQTLNEHSQNYKDEFPLMETDPKYETCLFLLIKGVHEFFKTQDKRPEFLNHLDDILIKFHQIERRILLLKISERNQDLLYRGYCQYEQLKIFINMNLDYINAIFSNPLQKYKNLLGQIQNQMQAHDDDDDSGIIQSNVDGLVQGAQIMQSNKAEINANVHFKTEIAFSHVKEHELVEASCAKGRLALGSANIELDLRVQLMQQACNQLRQNRFFLMAISMKEKEKNLLIQSFEYGESNEKSGDATQSAYVAPGSNQTHKSRHNVFDTLNDEKTIHQDIQRFRTSAKQFCCYFLICFFGKNLPLEMKRKDGFIMRGLASQSTFQLMEDLEALYKEKVSFVNDEEAMPDQNCNRFMIFLKKVDPFTINKRKKYRISDSQQQISQTLKNQKQKYPPEFKEYFKQNFQKQFFTTRRQFNDQLQINFKRYALSFMPKALELDSGDELNKEQAIKYYTTLAKGNYDRDLTFQEKEKFWAGLIKSKVVNQHDRVTQEDIYKAILIEWKGLTPMLQDLEVTVYEVEETFPTMYNMQKVVKSLTARISGVEQETINWQKRINKHIKVRKAVQQVFSLTQKPEDDDEQGLKQYCKKVGPKLRNLWDEIRMDIDTDQNGGVLMTLDVFFPNKESFRRVSIDNEENFRKYLQLFVTIETWFMQIQTSLLLFSDDGKNKIYDEYQRIMNPNDKLVMDNSINWFSKFTMKRQIFEQVRKKCDVDSALREEEEAMELEDSDD